jgi:uncharacterized protein (DUF3084 family)
MTTASVVLILAVLVLGGLIATVGDRIGTRVGKARLSLFKLRPRRTATLVTILTGTIISASTFGILFAASEQLRTGVFELEKIERRLRKSRDELKKTRDEKEQVETELEQAQADQAAAKKQLAETNQQLAGTQQRLTETNESLTAAIAERSRAQAEVARKQAELSQTRNQLATVYLQATQLRTEIEQLQAERNQLQTEREQLEAERDRLIAQREAEVRARDQVIQQKEAQLRDLESQQQFLSLAVQRLQKETEGLRIGNVAVERGQVLASGVARIVNPLAARRAVDQLLQEANRRAVQLVRPGTQEQIIQITNGEVDQLIQQIDDGQEYVVRVLASANYLIGETPIQVFANALRNRIVFQPGDVVATTTLEPGTMSDREIQQRISLLVSAANFRARNMGVLTDAVQISGPVQNLLTFINQLKQSQQVIELKAVATEATYTAGPLRLELIAEQNGQVLFRTQDPSATSATE